MTVVNRPNNISGWPNRIGLGMQVSHINGWAVSVFSETAYIPNLLQYGTWTVNGDPFAMDSIQTIGCYAGFADMQNVNYGVFYKNISVFGLAPNSTNVIEYVLDEPGKPLQTCVWEFQTGSNGNITGTTPLIPCIYDGDGETSAAVGGGGEEEDGGEEEEHLEEEEEEDVVETPPDGKPDDNGPPPTAPEEEEEDADEPPTTPSGTCSCGPPYNIGGGFTLEGFSYSANNGEVVFKHGSNKVFGFRYDPVTGVLNGLYRATAPGSVTQILI
jgi:hypothetical protein